MARAAARSGPGLGLWLALSVLVIVLDQFTKLLIVGDFQLGESRLVTSWFNVVRVHNSGAAFSFLAGASGWQRWFFVGIGALASGVMLWLLYRHRSQRLFAFAISFILGGAIGNVIDRLLYGHVVDFIQWHWQGWAFPSFNLADSAITLGAACLIADELRRIRRT